MVSIANVSAKIWDFCPSVVIGCKGEVGERLAALPKNQALHLPSLPPSFHASLTNAPSNATHPATRDNTYFALPIQPLHPDTGYIFSRSASNADFQLPEEAPPTTSVMEFRITINEHLERTLIDESLTGTSVNGTNLHSVENQTFLASTGYRLSKPESQIRLHTERPNDVRVGWGALQFNIYVLGKAADYYHYHYHSFALPSQSNLFSPTLSQSSPEPPKSPRQLAATHMLRTTDDVDAELDRQTGGDLTKGFYIDPARFVKVDGPCQRSVAAVAGGDMDMGSDDQEWTMLADLGQLKLRGEDAGVDATES